MSKTMAHAWTGCDISCSIASLYIMVVRCLPVGVGFIKRHIQHDVHVATVHYMVPQ